jgi:hypothetical protein
MTTVVKVGQVWKSDGRTDTYKITRIDGLQSYVIRADLKGVQREFIFGELKSDGTTDGWDPRWYPEEIAEVAKVSKSSGYQDDLDFFKATAPGNCVCNVTRSECTFHR